jgi:methylated-DNA-[protein]-cysteine S-methyltransferase
MGCFWSRAMQSAVPSDVSHTLVDTALGAIGLAWRATPRGVAIVRLQLPTGDQAATEQALTRRLDSARATALPEEIERIAGMIRAYAAGDSVDFSGVEVDVGPVEPIRRAIYAALRKLGHGETLTYGELADRAGFPGLAQAVGQAMGRNPVPLIIPCHRVLAAGGKLGGFSAPGGVTTKERMLKLERAIAEPAQGSLF